MKISLAGYDNKIYITQQTTLEELKKFVAEEINHWIHCYVDDNLAWTHPIEYEPIFDEELGHFRFDRSETVKIHTEKLREFILEDFKINIQNSKEEQKND